MIGCPLLLSRLSRLTWGSTKVSSPFSRRPQSLFTPLVGVRFGILSLVINGLVRSDSHFQLREDLEIGGAPYDYQSSGRMGRDGNVSGWEMADNCNLLCCRQRFSWSTHNQRSLLYMPSLYLSPIHTVKQCSHMVFLIIFDLRQASPLSCHHRRSLLRALKSCCMLYKSHRSDSIEHVAAAGMWPIPASERWKHAVSNPNPERATPR